MTTKKMKKRKSNRSEERRSDSLFEMFEKQKQLQKLAYNEQTDLPQDRPNLFYTHTTACIVELSEAIQCDTRWKEMLGSKRVPVTDSEAKLEELVDALHFLINAVLFSGYDYEEFVAMYFKKGKVNVNRQMIK